MTYEAVVVPGEKAIKVTRGPGDPAFSMTNDTACMRYEALVRDCHTKLPPTGGHIDASELALVVKYPEGTSNVSLYAAHMRIALNLGNEVERLSFQGLVSSSN